MNDVYNKDEFENAFMIASFIDRSSVDPYYNLSLIDDEYKMNEKGYLYFLAYRYIDHMRNGTLFNNPCVYGYDNDTLRTFFGDVHFSLCTASFTSFLNNEDLKDVYLGKYFNRCHEICVRLGFGDIVTGFVNSPIDGYKFLHSFTLNGDYVYDFARNLRMEKNEYFDLLEPDIVSIIFKDDILEDFNYYTKVLKKSSYRGFVFNYNFLR